MTTTPTQTIAGLLAALADIRTGLDPPQWNARALQIIDALPALLAEREAMRTALDAINERAANWHTGFGTKENRHWIYETSGKALLPAPPYAEQKGVGDE